MTYHHYAMSHALVTPRLLTWSRLRAGLSEFDVADKIPVKPEKVFEWEVGDSQPTFKQAQKWALLSHIPFGFLFLKEPPSDELPLPDLRTLGGAAPARPSPELVDAVKDVLWKHSWYLDYLKEHEFGPLPFVGRFTSQSPVKEVVADMRKTLHVAENAARPTHEEFLRTLIAAAESVGILVMRSGIVGTNTHRKLDVGEFRGFAISNPLAPVVFINSADAPAARLFTLVHELAHVWINSSGISSVSVNANRREEIFCNAVAGEFLAPEAAFRQAWRGDVDWKENLPVLAADFKVSKLVIARRAADLGLIAREAYSGYYLAELQAYRDKDNGGGNFYRNAGAKNSARFSRAVLAETMRGNMLLRDAARLLGIQPSKMKAYASTVTE
ncbi:XRE family transcriptional regulator [Cupriavidus basilensis]|uniref:XRE family transcriptional regulator n=1 Tax=Cupriavidus basilensis TaxID=68895 RepID=UPI0018CC7FF7|nr:ImmA/IrrE family metallo-endopeptidase [Cupriavidus basilensis]